MYIYYLYSTVNIFSYVIMINLGIHLTALCECANSSVKC